MEGILQKFNDAVSLVQKLPKDGPYKVSHNTKQLMNEGIFAVSKALTKI